MEVANELTGNTYVWEFGRLPTSVLTEDYQSLLRVVQNSLIPTSNNADIDLYMARIVYAIGTDMRVDLAQLIFDIIEMPSVSKAQNVSIKLGALITRICVDAGVVSKVGDEMVKAKSVVGAASVNRSKGQKKKRTRASLDEGPSSVPPNIPTPDTSPATPHSSQYSVPDEFRGLIHRLLDQQELIMDQQKRMLLQQDQSTDTLLNLRNHMDSMDARLATIETRFHPLAPASGPTAAPTSHPNSEASMSPSI